MTKTLKCIHRHTIHSHPNCFLMGRIKHNFRDDREWERLVGLPWWLYPGEDGKPLYRIGFFDLETDNLKPDWGTLLTWAIKEKDGDLFTSVVTREELFTGVQDRRLVKDFLDVISDFDILCGYYSTGFDMPYIRAKALHYNLGFPGYELRPRYDGKFFVKPEIIHWDLYYVVRNKLRLSRNSLWNACRYLGIEGKTPIDREVWARAKYGDPEAIEDVLDHNIADVIITEKLWERLQPYQKWNRRPA